jgi:hypothetical protein
MYLKYVGNVCHCDKCLESITSDAHENACMFDVKWSTLLLLNYCYAVSDVTAVRLAKLKIFL